MPLAESVGGAERVVPEQGLPERGAVGDLPGSRGEPIRWYRLIAPVSIHAVCLGVIFVGWSWAAVIVALSLYILRMFVITAFYHRYFSHRTFRTSRFVQALFAFFGTTCAQRGPLWWAAHHREHHRHSDEPPDVHSPVQHGFGWSHAGWFVSEPNIPTMHEHVPDLCRYPELKFIDRWHLLGPLALIAFCYGLGSALEAWRPEWGTSGAQMVVFGFGISTTLLYHGTFTINSLAHTWGSRRYKTDDDSRNNFFLAIITLGEGWHNNHHFYPGTARQGFYWWEIDLTYYVLKAMEAIRLVRDVRPVPAFVYERAGARAG
jgi:stearoyl-CoA desaturase (delta-9 desaturase)